MRLGVGCAALPRELASWAVTFPAPWLPVTLPLCTLALWTGVELAMPTPSVIDSTAAPVKAANDLGFIPLPHAVNATLGGRPT
jgi:hypothetical protein